MLQRTFSPLHFNFSWTIDNSWYTWDREAAHKAARKARDTEAKALVKSGRTVSKFSIPNQLVKQGGIGSGCPEISAVVTVYGINAI